MNNSIVVLLYLRQNFIVPLVGYIIFLLPLSGRLSKLAATVFEIADRHNADEFKSWDAFSLEKKTSFGTDADRLYSKSEGEVIVEFLGEGTGEANGVSMKSSVDPLVED